MAFRCGSLGVGWPTVSAGAPTQCARHPPTRQAAINAKLQTLQARFDAAPQTYAQLSVFVHDGNNGGAHQSDDAMAGDYAVASFPVGLSGYGDAPPPQLQAVECVEATGSHTHNKSHGIQFVSRTSHLMCRTTFRKCSTPSQFSAGSRDL